MAEGNGVTRREFDRLQRQVDNLSEYGSPALRGLERRLDELERETDKRLGGLMRVGVGILLALFTGLVTLLTAIVLLVLQ